MLSAQPKRLSDEIAQKLSYTTSTEVDEFTLHSWRCQLEDLGAKRGLDAAEFTAMGQVYFNLGQYSQFLENCRAGLEQYKELGLLEEKTLGSLMLAYVNKIAKSPREILEEWFASDLNPERRSIAFYSRPTGVVYWDLSLDFRVRPTVAIDIDERLVFTITTGPITQIEHYPYIEAVRFEFMVPILDLYCNEALSPVVGVDEKTQHLRNILDERSFEMLQKYIDEELSDSAEDDEQDIADAEETMRTFVETAGEGFVRVADVGARPQ